MSSYNSLYIYIVFINYLNRIYIIQLGYPIVNKHVWMMRRLRSENHSCSFQLFGYDFMVRNYCLPCTFLRIFMSSLHFLCSWACASGWHVGLLIGNPREWQNEMFQQPSRNFFPTQQPLGLWAKKSQPRCRRWMMSTMFGYWKWMCLGCGVCLAMGISWVRFVKNKWLEGVGKIMGKNGWYWLGSWLIVVNDG